MSSFAFAVIPRNFTESGKCIDVCRISGLTHWSIFLDINIHQNLIRNRSSTLYWFQKTGNADEDVFEYYIMNLKLFFVSVYNLQKHKAKLLVTAVHILPTKPKRFWLKSTFGQITRLSYLQMGWPIHTKKNKRKVGWPKI